MAVSIQTILKSSLPKGDTGFIGSQGDIGYTGSQGAGFTGSQGDLGYTGSIGFTGSRGNTGFTGSQGTVGAQGFTGSQGDIGYTGSQGAGFTGSQGITGFVGSLGYTGSIGPIGYTGSAGSDGGGVDSITLYQSGNLTVLSGTARWYAPYNLEIISIKTRLKTAADSNISILIRKNDVTAVSLVITANSTSGTEYTTPLSLVEDDFLTVDVVTIGSEDAPGVDLYVSFKYQSV
jgi:hypothetical protein